MQEIAKALIEFQSGCPSVSFDKENPHFHSRFASLKNILKTIGPALEASRLSVTQFPESQNVGDRVCVGCRTIVLHESGESIEHSFVFPVAKQDPQAAMAALTYARRGSLGAVLGLVIEEDDEDGGALGLEGLANAGKKAPRQSAPKAMSQANIEKLKSAAADRLDGLTDHGSDIGDVLDQAARDLGYSLRMELKDSDYKSALEKVREFEPIPF